MSERHEGVAIASQRSPRIGQVRFDEMKRKRIVSGRYRCMRCEDGRLANLFEGGVERVTVLDVIADALQDDERGVSFIEMPCSRRHAECLQRAYAADPENDFLLHPCLAIAAVQACRQFAIP